MRSTSSSTKTGTLLSAGFKLSKPGTFVDYVHITVGTSASLGGAIHIAPPMAFKTAYVVPYTTLVASVPERYTGNLRDGLFSFPLPISLPEHTVSMLWHPRMDADPAHRDEQ